MTTHTMPEMPEPRKPTKRHLDRLRGALRDLDERERRLQEWFGDRIKGSARSSDYRLAEALRAVLAYVDCAAAIRSMKKDEE